MEIEIDPPRKPTGRPSSYTFEVSEAICEQMAGGKGLRQICSQEGMPSRPTVLMWLEDNAGFRDRYARAREALMDWYSEEILRIAFDDSGDLIIDGDRVMSGHHVVQHARLKVDTVKWIMAKLHPGRYGERPRSRPAGRSRSSGSSRTRRRSHPSQRHRNRSLTSTSLPADLSEGDWSKLLQILEVAKRVALSDSVPDDVLEVIRKALLAHYAEEKPAKPIVLKPRCRK
jgi:hypothetical protein